MSVQLLQIESNSLEPVLPVWIPSLRWVLSRGSLGNGLLLMPSKIILESSNTRSYTVRFIMEAVAIGNHWHALLYVKRITLRIFAYWVTHEFSLVYSAAHWMVFNEVFFSCNIYNRLKQNPAPSWRQR